MQELFTGFLALIIIVWSLNRIGKRGIAQIEAASARVMVEKTGAAVIDVRNAGEFRNGHIKGAVLLPLGEMENRIHELVPFKDRQILLVCLSGNRSMAAARMLKKNGFAKIANLRGGMMAWTGNGFPVTTSP
jgi:rhodanese-related sulfurtransferase